MPAQPIVGIRETVSQEQIGTVMGPMYEELHRFVMAKGATPASPPIAICHAFAAEVDVECAIPLASIVPGQGRIATRELPGGSVATITHVGPYDRLKESWDALQAWMEQEGYQPHGAPWETYVTDPQAEQDPAKWRTEIRFPIRA